MFNAKVLPFQMFLLNPEETTLDERQCDLGYVYNTDDLWLWIDLLAQFRIGKQFICNRSINKFPWSNKT